MSHKENEKHRVIGIRHALKRLRKADLVDKDTMYPDRAVQDIELRLSQKAETWYKIGIRRGIQIALDTIENRDFEIEYSNDDVDILANTEEIVFKNSMHVTLNSRKVQISIDVAIPIEELGFE